MCSPATKFARLETSFNSRIADGTPWSVEKKTELSDILKKMYEEVPKTENPIGYLPSLDFCMRRYEEENEKMRKLIQSANDSLNEIKKI